ncbi:alpha/beta fold hydrolase, partial [Ilumatobacter sp.]|uniref:alpha/beta fold hydrolase n=1 Tax=Ilumatobacter sp. TaxID=1967498 RepID=UPI003C6F20DC
AREALLAAPPTDRDAFIEASTRADVWASKRYVDHDAMKARAARDFDRSFYPQGATRQLAAIYASGDRSDGLRALDVPTLVIHGRDDTLITPSGGETTAELIAGSRYLFVSDMGHDLPAPLWPMFAETIGGHVRLVEAAWSKPPDHQLDPTSSIQPARSNQLDPTDLDKETTHARTTRRTSHHRDRRDRPRAVRGDAARRPRRRGHSRRTCRSGPRTGSPAAPR